jgi:hypothetical protein
MEPTNSKNPFNLTSEDLQSPHTQLFLYLSKYHGVSKIKVDNKDVPLGSITELPQKTEIEGLVREVVRFNHNLQMYICIYLIQ